MRQLSKNYIKPIGGFFAAIGLCLIILVWVMRLWVADLRIPFAYSGDAFLVGMNVKGIIDNGWGLHNIFLGAPATQYMYDFPQSHNLDNILIKLISIFASDYAKTMNLYFLLTFPLTTLSSMLVFRQFRISYAPSILGSLLFTFVPYHFLRGEPHLYLAAYYLIPPMVMVILWVFTDKSFLFQCNENNGGNRLINKKFILIILICLSISSTFIYYPFFSCFFLVIAGMVSYFSQQNKYPLLNSLVLISIIILGVLINTSSTLIYQYENGKNTEAAIRSPIESEIYGLKIDQLLMPISGHRIHFLARLSETYSKNAPLVNENSIASLGLIGGIGFMMLIVWLFYSISQGRFKNNNLYCNLYKLSILNISAILLATIGSFGFLFAYLISPQIRCYNRISIFIAFFSFMAIALFLEKFSQKYMKSNAQRLIFSLFIGLVLMVGILDQTSSSFVPPYASNKEEYLNDEIFVNNIEKIMPENAMIFQLPYVPFPESSPINRMADYSHLRGYLHSKDLRWSYGAMKGRPWNDWQRLVAALPTEDMVQVLDLTGFKGIYIDSYGFNDSGAELISNIEHILETEPIVSANNRLYFFDMTRHNGKIGFNRTEKKMATVVFDLGWHDPENFSNIPIRWMQSDATLMTFSTENRTANLTMQSESFYRPRTLEVYMGEDLVAGVAVPSTRYINVTAAIRLKRGVNTIRLHVPEGCERPCDIKEMNNSDYRCLSIAVQNVTVA